MQDAASKGLCVVYECCSEQTRTAMVEGLVHALTEGKSRVANVTSDTKIFQEVIIIYHDFVPTPRRGSYVKSDKTLTQSSRYTPRPIYLTAEP